MINIFFLSFIFLSINEGFKIPFFNNLPQSIHTKHKSDILNTIYNINNIFLPYFNNNIDLVDMSLPKNINTSNLFLIFPGLNGIDYNINNLKNNVISSDNNFKFNRLSCICNWNTNVNIFSVSKLGDYMGKKYSNQINKLTNNKKLNIHIVGISAGAFAADYCTKYLKQFNKNHYIHLTLLDPFLLQNINPYYGKNNFGKYADYCEQYLNTDDPVPFTNSEIKNAYVIDVTYSKLKKNFLLIKNKDENSHSWPIYYFVNYWDNLTNPHLYHPNHNINKRGTKIKLF